jgi:hypothetical protein
MTGIGCSRRVHEGGRSAWFRPCANRATTTDSDGQPVCGIHKRADEQREVRRREWAAEYEQRETEADRAAARTAAVTRAAPHLDPSPVYRNARTGMGRYDPQRVEVDYAALATLLGIQDAP